MRRGGWHILREDARITLSRSLPVRWDISAETRLPDAPRLRIAHQVRQDLWRALQRQRGFQPVVAVTRVPEGLWVRAGGRIDGRFAAGPLTAQILGILESPRNRARWLRFSPERGQISGSRRDVNRFLKAAEGAS